MLSIKSKLLINVYIVVKTVLPVVTDHATSTGLVYQFGVLQQVWPFSVVHDA